MIKFEGFPKIPRLKRDCVITEKIDGTNAQVFIDDEGGVHAGSRNRMLTLNNDHYGFARWVNWNQNELRMMGPGRHFGEWWGRGIEHGYGLEVRRFSLFNVARWGDPKVRPECCDVVPVLYKGAFTIVAVDAALEQLWVKGSVAAPGTSAEGVVVFHTASGWLSKVTLGNDGVRQPKKS